MKYRNEIVLLACFVIGNIVASWPGEVTDYAERAEKQARIASSETETHSLLVSGVEITTEDRSEAL